MTRRTESPPILASAAALATLALALACTNAPTARTETLRVADIRQAATSLVFVAEDQGCFAREGLRVEERTFELGREALELLAKGQADVAVAYETPTLRRFLADQSLRVLATLHTSTQNTRIIARRDRIREARDLRGARVGVPVGTNAEFFLASVLTFAAVDRSQVTVVPLAPERGAPALAAGEVDAIASFDPHAAEARALLGEKAVEIRGEVYTEFSLVSTRPDVIAGRREALKRFLRGLLCAEAAVRKGAPAAFLAVKRRIPERNDADLRDALARVRRTVAVDGLLLAVLRSEAEWLWAGAGAPAAMPDVSALLDASLLDEVDPEAVNIPLRP